jgi:N6-L-threonylcarbamoyladenine synthase
MTNKYDFSFSGLKTAVLRLAQSEIGQSFDFPSYLLSERLNESQKANIAASFQRIAVETVVDKVKKAILEFSPSSIVIAGGVASSSELRRQMQEAVNIDIEFTDPKLCTDNGAMIAVLGCYSAKHSKNLADPYKLDPNPNLSM